MNSKEKLSRRDFEKDLAALTAELNEWKTRYQQLLEHSKIDRQQGDQQIGARLVYEQMLSACSQVLLANVEAGEALTETLYELMVGTGASRVFIAENFVNDTTGDLCMRQTHEMCALQVPSQQYTELTRQVCYADGLSRWEQELSQDHPVYGPLDSFPESEQHFLTARGATSILLIPIWVKGRWYGLLGIEELSDHRRWRDEDLQLLQTVVNMIGSYIGRRNAEKALKESEEKYRTLIEQSQDAIFLIYGGRFELVNRRFTELFGITLEDTHDPDFSFSNIVEAKKRGEIRRLTQETDQEEEHRPPYEFVALDKAGNEIHVDLTVSYPFYKRGLATQGAIRDITDRKRMERERRQAYQKIQEYAHELAIKIRDEQRQREIATILAEVVSSVSLTLTKDELLSHILIRLQQLIAYDVAAVYLAEGDYLIREAIHGAKPDSNTSQMPVKNNPLFHEMQTKKSYILVDDTETEGTSKALYSTTAVRSWIGAPLLVAQKVMGYLAVERNQPHAYTFSDAELVQAFAHQVAQTIHNARLFTELKEAQAQLVQRERLAALGQMAATVAHELRNPLMSLRMGVEYLTFDMTEDDPLYRAATLMESNMDRIERVVDNILFVARTPRLDLESESLLNLVEQELVQWEMKLAQNDIILHADLPDSAPNIYIDADQIERVLSNLVGNSVDAMGSGGELTVQLKAEAKRQMIVIADTGPGISDNNQDKIFEPFFTTKSRGTGLGLAIVKQIIESHGGAIDLWSQLGQGTRFTISLPQNLPLD